MIKIFCGIPIYHAVEPEPFLNFLMFAQYCGIAEKEGKYSVRFCTPGPKCKTVSARNIISKLALAAGADYVLMMDDDIVVPRTILDHLLRRDVDIVSPLFFRSNPPIDPLVYVLDDLKGRVPYYDYPKNAIFEAPGGTGTGVMLIKTKVLKNMEAPIWVGAKDPEIAEDINFCDRALKLGYKTYCDSTIECRQMSLPVAVGSQHYEQERLTQ